VGRTGPQPEGEGPHTMLTLAAFQVDCTPPAGFPIGFGVDGVEATVRDPLYMRGFVLDDGELRVVLASLDYCCLFNSAQDEMVAALAAAVGTAPARVALHCVHQHDAPLLNFEAGAYLGVEPYPRPWWTDQCAACAAAAAACLPAAQEVTCVGHAETRLHGYASNRRVVGDDGQVVGVRFSRCADPDLVAAPVGIIDPMLRTLAFRGPQGNTLASVSFYATHPQVANGRGMYSADAPGEALRLIDEQAGEGQHAYFSGFSGNVTAGKYSSHADLEGNLAAFGRRLADGIGANLAGMQWEEAPSLALKETRFTFPAAHPNRDAATGPAPAAQRLAPAAVLACAEYAGNREYALRLLQVGGNRLLLAGGEPFVEYQLYAQSLAPDEFVAAVGNCGDSFLYLPLAEHLNQGGYEVGSFMWCTAEFEARFKAATRALIGGGQRGREGAR